MHVRLTVALLLALPVLIGASLAACGSDGSSAATDTLGVDTSVASDVVDDVEADALSGDTETGDTAATDTASPDTTTPVEAFSAPGPYGVGYMAESLTYTPPGDTDPRTLRVVFWYPTHDAEGEDATYASILPAPGVLGGAAPATDLGELPVLLFSHGNGGFAEQSYFFTEFFASHGFLVGAVDHTSNTFVDIQSDMDPRIFRWRPADMSALLDHIEGLSAEHPLHGLASERVALSGHSFGGYTSFAAGGAGFAVDLVLAYCQAEELPGGACDSVETDQDLYRAGFYDDRIEALVPMSPGGMILFTNGFDTVSPPTLLFTGSADETTPNVSEGDLAWNGIASSGGNLRVDFATAGHFTFSDACALELGIGADDGCGEDNIDADAAHVAIDAYALAFLKLHLLGDTGGVPLLDGSVTIEDDATLTVGAE